jgi:hypothetical protein
MNVTATKTDARTGGFNLRGEAPGRAVEVFDGVWLIATRHRPGLSRHIFEVNNRCLVFRLYDQRAAKPVLLVVNGVDPAQAIPEVRRIERATGLQVSAIVSPGRRAAAITCSSSPGTPNSSRRACWSVRCASRARATAAG